MVRFQVCGVKVGSDLAVELAPWQIAPHLPLCSLHAGRLHASLLLPP